MKHFLKDNDLSVYEQSKVLKLALDLAKNPDKFNQTLEGHSIGLLFQKQSLRTRVSSEVACVNLGAHPVHLRGEELHFNRGESVGDAVQVLSGYLSLLMGRVNEHSLLEELASHNQMPIVNGLSDKFHPLQALADLLTMKQLWGEEIRGRTITYVGDGNNVSNSLMFAGVMAGLNVRVATPKEFQPIPEIVDEVCSLAQEGGGTLSLFDDPIEAVKQTDAIYTDVWVSMGDEAKTADKKKSLEPYQVNQSLILAAGETKNYDDVAVLHCLPAHRGEEITAEVLEGPHSKVIKQAHNRLPSVQALFLFLLKPEVVDE